MRSDEYDTATQRPRNGKEVWSFLGISVSRCENPATPYYGNHIKAEGIEDPKYTTLSYRIEVL